MQFPRIHNGWPLAAAAWFGTRAIEFLTGGDAFETAPIYAAFRHLPVSEDVWGLVFGTYAIGTAIALYANPLLPRLAACLGGMLLGLFAGSLMMVGYWQAVANISGGGLFSILIGLGCAVALVQLGRGNGT